eukprot:sb/3476351/
MEVVSLSNTPSYRRMILQHGKGLDKEGYYVYDQNGEGVGAVFSSILRGAVPILAPLAAEGVKNIVDTVAKKAIKRARPTSSTNHSSEKRRISNSKRGSRIRSNKIKRRVTPYPVKARV